MWTIIWLILLAYAGYVLWDKYGRDSFRDSSIRPPGYIIPAESPMLSLEMRREGGACAPIARPISKPLSKNRSAAETIPVQVAPDVAADTGASVKESMMPSGGSDDLTRIKGIGAVTAGQLNKLGIISYAQLAAMTEEELGGLELSVRSRETWIEQAKELVV